MVLLTRERAFGILLASFVLGLCDRDSAKTPANRTLIGKEIQRLGIGSSGKEREIWKTQGFPSLSDWPKDDREMLARVHNRFDTTLMIMFASENPYFLEATQHLGKPSLKRWFSLPQDRNKTPGRDALARPDVTETTIDWGIELSPTALLFQNALQASFVLTHVAEHVRSMVALDIPHQTKTPQERFYIQLKRLTDPQTIIEEEALAYGVQAQAFIHQAGLLGTWNEGSMDERIAVAFIKTGSSSQSSTWINFVTNTFLAQRLKNLQKTKTSAPGSEEFPQMGFVV